MRTNTGINTENDVVDEIMHSMDFLDEQALKETLAFLLKVYVLDRGVNFEGDIRQTPNIGPLNGDTVPNAPETRYANFLEMIMAMKSKYSFPELNMFSVEGGCLYITINGRRQPMAADHVVRSVPAIPAREPHPVTENQPAQPAGRFRKLELD